MGSWGFLVSRRWALFAVAVALAAYAAWWLGEWQFHRLADRKESNAIVRSNESLEPAPVAEVLAPSSTVGKADEWRLVTATGSYQTAETIIVRYRTRDGESGVDVVVPLVTSDGTALLVDRGWMATENAGEHSLDTPAPPSGTVTVTGWVRADGTGDSTQVDDLSTRAVNSDRIGEALDRELYSGFVELKSEDPGAADPLEPVELPELDNGPHFFYGLQWWFFGILAVGGFLYLAFDEMRRGPRGQRGPDGATGDRGRAPKKVRQSNVDPRFQRPRSSQSARSIPPSTGSITPVTKEAAGDSTKAAARPNSAGSP